MLRLEGCSLSWMMKVLMCTSYVLKAHHDHSFPRRQRLFANLKKDIENSNLDLASNIPVMTENANLVRHLERATDIPHEIIQMSAFESLEAMSFKEYQKTSCVICMGSLGSSDPNSACEASPGLVALTPCGHLFCATCIGEYIESQTASFRQPQCPTCRKDIERKELINVRPISLCANLEQKEAVGTFSCQRRV
jgi:hypothetical protein